MDLMNATQTKTQQESVFEKPLFKQEERQKQKTPYEHSFAPQKEELKTDRKKAVAEMLGEAFAMRGNEATQLVVPEQSVLSSSYKDAYHERTFYFKTREQKVINMRERLNQKQSNAGIILLADEEKEKFHREWEKLIRSVSYASISELGITQAQFYDLSELALLLKEENEPAEERLKEYINHYSNQGDSNQEN